MLHARLAGRVARHAGLRFFRFFARKLDAKGIEAPGVRCRLLWERDVIELCRDPELDLRQDSVKAALTRGELCAGAFTGDSLVGYCWFAFAPLPHLDGGWVEFDWLVAWPYKSFVRSAHRGQGIAAALYRFADAACLERGRVHSVICVESHNAPSVKAALKAGFAPAGYGGYVRSANRLFSWCSPSAKTHGIAFFLPPEP